MSVSNENKYDEEIRSGFRVSPIRKRSWNVLLGLLSEFDSFCNEYGLKYFVCFGSLLGAVRHRGFIPWDDDIDVAMMRKDYTRMQQLAPEYFKAPYRFEDAYSNTGHAFMFSKLRDNRTTVLETFGHEDRLFQSMYIDIFPWDDMPDGNNLTDLTLYMSNELWMLVVDPDRAGKMYDEGYKFAIGRDTVAGLLNASFDMRFRAFETFMTGLEGKSTAVNLLAEKFLEWGGHKDGLRAWFADTVRVPFENLSVPVPVGYQRIMLNYFGDYMTPVMHASAHEGICIDPDHPYTDYEQGIRDIDDIAPLDGEMIGAMPENNDTDVFSDSIKTLFIYIDASFLISEPENSLASIRELTDRIRERSRNADALWFHTASDIEMLSKAPGDKVDEYLGLLDSFEKEGLGKVIREDSDDVKIEDLVQFADAYYGDGSYMATLFREMAKPVAIRKMEYGS